MLQICRVKDLRFVSIKEIVTKVQTSVWFYMGFTQFKWVSFIKSLTQIFFEPFSNGSFKIVWSATNEISNFGESLSSPTSYWLKNRKFSRLFL